MIDVLNALPHQPPMRLLDDILSADETHLHALVSSPHTSLFASPKGIPSVVAMEYIAQACAAYFAFHAAAEDAHPQRPGMLVACRSLTATAAYLPQDAPLHVIVHPPDASIARQTPTLVRFAGTVGTQPQAPLVHANVSVYL